MGAEQATDQTREALSAVATEVRAWRQAHRQATWYEIEVAVEARLAAVRALLVAEAAGGDGAAERVEATARPSCPECGRPMAFRGQQSRDLLGRGGEPMRLVRRYAVCPACGAGLFPPG